LSIKNLCRGLPLVGGLAEARWRDHREAAKEVSVNILLSTAPIWLGCLFLWVSQKFAMSPGEVVIRNVENGELFIYATSIVAPMYYFIFKESEGNQKFPNAGSFMLISAIVLLIGGCGFALTRLGTVLGTSFRWDEVTLFVFSAILYLIAVIVVYLAHVYRNWRETGGAAAFATDTQDFVAAFNREPKNAFQNRPANARRQMIEQAIEVKAWCISSLRS
jgi:hypothetical protein